jgi:hypothetical protein
VKVDFFHGKGIRKLAGGCDHSGAISSMPLFNFLV